MSNGKISENGGFEALADLDENGDGVIDANDSAFADLKVWIDSANRGVSDFSELKTLTELGIVSISLTTKAKTRQIWQPEQSLPNHRLLLLRMAQPVK